jgi:hypothetical protein
VQWNTKDESVMLGLLRLKFEIHELVEQILDQLPDHVWMDPNIMFLDPAMAGGQFIRAIERRLKAAGHSDESITARVYGCEQKLIRVKYVKNWHKVLSDHLYVQDFITHDWGNMKFDVIVGNPPYQNENKSSDKIWCKFVLKSFSVCKPGGHVCLITPNGWFHKPQGQKFKSVSDMFVQNQLQYVNLDASSYFPNIGESIGWWTCVNSPNNQTVTCIQYEGTTYHKPWTGEVLALTPDQQMVKQIIAKFLKDAVPHEFYHDYVHDVNTQDLIQNKVISEKKTRTHACEIYWSASQTMWGKPQDVHDGWKVIINKSGYYHLDADPDKYITYDRHKGVGQLAFGIKCGSRRTCANVTSYLRSNLYVWFMTQIKTNGWNDPVRKLPRLNSTLSWTDDLVFQHFGLSQQEIEFVDRTRLKKV